MNMTEIDNALRQLRLSGMQQTLSTRAMQAQASQEPFLETFAALLQDELERRSSVLMERRYKVVPEKFIFTPALNALRRTWTICR